MPSAVPTKLTAIVFFERRSVKLDKFRAHFQDCGGCRQSNARWGRLPDFIDDGSPDLVLRYVALHMAIERGVERLRLRRDIDADRRDAAIDELPGDVRSESRRRS